MHLKSVNNEHILNKLISHINLSEIELKHILTEIKCLTAFDFTSFSYTFIKRRTEFFMFQNNISNESDFIYKINKSSVFAGLFLETVFFQNDELFRDAEVWNLIKKTIIPKLLKKNEINIHFPYSTGKEDVCSFLYIIKNFNTENFKIYVTGVTDKHISNIKHNSFAKSNLKLSEKNISLLNDKTNIDDVFNKNGNYYKIKTSFNGKIIYETCDFFKKKSLSEFDIVFFRNKMIFFNQELKQKALSSVVRSLKRGGYIIIGEKEKIDENAEKTIKQVKKGISIYKRKTFLLSWKKLNT